MGPLGVVVADILPQQCDEVPLVEHDEMVEAVSPQGPNNSLRDGIRARSPNRAEERRYTETFGAVDEIAAIDTITVTDQEAWLPAPSGRFQQLAPYPGCGGVGRNVEVDELTPVMGNEE